MDPIKEIRRFLDFLGIKDYEIVSSGVDTATDGKLKIAIRRGERRQRTADATYYPRMNLILIDGATEPKLGRLGLLYLLAHELSHMKDSTHGKRFREEFFNMYKKIREYIRRINNEKES